MEGPLHPREEVASEEHIAERTLEAILDNPEHAFLVEIPRNLAAIEAAESAVEGLKIAQDLIDKRLERTFRFEPIGSIDPETFEVHAVSAEGTKRFLVDLIENNQFVGEGGDAFVLMADSDLIGLPPEVCYKIAKVEEVKRGRNPMTKEADIQSEVYALMKELETSKIGVPCPYYVVEIGAKKVMAMEKLPAKSVDDILHGRGSLPAWLDIDTFFDELEQFITAMHSLGVYHRDLHFGNVMIRQSAVAPEDGKWGYVIDFGVSGHGVGGIDPYIKETTGGTFTFNDDYGIVLTGRAELKKLKKRLETMVE